MALKRFLAAEAERHPVLLVDREPRAVRPGHDQLPPLPRRRPARSRASRSSAPRHAAAVRAPPGVRRRRGRADADRARRAVAERGRGAAARAVPLARRGARPRCVAHVRTLGGSPRAIHELVRLLLESDVHRPRGHHVAGRRRRASRRSTLPKTYDEIVAARLRVMEPTERRVLEMAAVVGETSWLDAILALERHGQRTSRSRTARRSAQIAASGDHSRLAVVAAIGKLDRARVARRGAAVVDRRASASCGSRTRTCGRSSTRASTRPSAAAYHAAVARWLELHPEGRGPAAQEEVAPPPRARRRGPRGRDPLPPRRRGRARAVRERDARSGCSIARSPASATRDLAARIHLWHDLGSVYELIGDFEAALGAFERMLRLSWVAASKTKAAVAFNKMGRVWRRKGDLKLALEYLERGLELFRGAGRSARHRRLARRHRQVAPHARPLRRGARQDHRGARAPRQARRQARDRDLAVAARRRPAGPRPVRRPR